MAVVTGSPGEVRRQRLRRWAVAVVALFAVVAAVVWAIRPRPPEPPAVALDGLEPAVRTAVEQATAEVRQRPREAASWGRLGMLLMAYRFFPEAEACLTEATRLDRRDPRWPYHLGAIRSQTDAEGAVRFWQQALDHGGEHQDVVRLKLADALAALGREAEARGHYEALVRRQPDHPPAHFGLARLDLEQGRWADCLSHLARASASRQTRKAATALRAAAHHRMGEAATARQAEEEAATLPEDQPERNPLSAEVTALRVDRQARLQHVTGLLDRGRLPEALAALRQLAREEPDYTPAWLTLGAVLSKAGDHAAAGAALGEALRLQPDSADAHFHLGCLNMNRRQFDRATDHLDRVVALKPDHGLAHLNLGLCRKLRGDRPGAKRAFREAVKVRPDLGDAHRLLGELLAEDGNTDEAAAHLKQAVEIDPSDEAARAALRKLRPASNP